MAEDWSTLPLDLLAAIIMRLETWEDFIYISVVCRWWNIVSVLIKHNWKPTPMPWFLLAENIKDNPGHFRKIFNICNNKCYSFSLPDTFGTRCLGSAYGWVALASRDFNVQLFNPITKAQILYPSLEPLLSHMCTDFDKNNEEDILWFLRSFIYKLLVIKVPRGDHEEFVIVAFNSNALFYARHEDQLWTLVLHKETMLMMVDVVCMDDHVFAMYDDGAIIYWNVSECFGLGGVKPLNYCSGKPAMFDKERLGVEKMYLVQCGGDLVMVVRNKDEPLNSDGTDVDFDIPYTTLGFKVYKLYAKDKSWEEIDDLGDVTLFLGNNSSMCVYKASAKGLQNCIYFTDDESQYWELLKEFGGYDMSVYHLKCGKIVPFYEVDDTRSLFCTPTWFIT